MTEFVPIKFEGDASDAVSASRQVRQAIREVERQAAGSSQKLESAARGQVAASARQVSAQRQLRAEYERVAAAAKSGSAEQVAAMRLAEREARKLGETVHYANGQAVRGFDASNKSLGQFVRGGVAGSGVFAGFGRSLAFASGGFLGAAGFTAAVRGGFDELKQGQLAGAQTNAVLKSTGDVAGVTADKVDQLADSLLRQSGIDDEAIRGMENLLLTFTNVRDVAGEGNDIFDQATQATLDMSVAMGEDLNAAAIRVGKALQDPIAGMTALRRVGVQFTADQKEQVIALVNSGKTLEAQKLILAELNREFGGSAKAAGETMPGAIGKLQQTLRNLEAELLDGLTPSISGATRALQEKVDWLTNTEEGQEKLRQTTEEVKDAVLGFAGVIHDAYGIAHSASDAVGGLRNALELLLAFAVARKFNPLLLNLTAIGTAAGPAGATGKVVGLRAALGSLGPVAIIVAATFLTQFKPVRDMLDSMKLSAQDLVRAFVGVDHKGGLLDILVGREGHRGALGNWLFPASKTAAEQTKGALPATQGMPATKAKFNLPTSFTATHKTEGPGWPAVDLMAKPGTKLGAPEDGQLTRISGHPPSEAAVHQGGPWGLSFYFIGDSGTVYFATHLAAVAKEGYYKKGAVIALIGDYPGSKSDHVHWAIVGRGDQAAAVARQPSTQQGTLGAGGAAPPQANKRGGSTKKSTATSAGSSLQVSGKLSQEQQDNARLIYELATAHGLSPEQALKLVAIAYAESELKTDALNAGHSGLFQLGPGYLKRYKALRAKGYDAATANVLAILPDYEAFFKKSPQASVGAAARAVERPNPAHIARAGGYETFYGKAIKGGLISLGAGGGRGGRAGKSDVVPVGMQEALERARLTKSMADDLKALEQINVYLTKKLALEQDANKRIAILRELKSVRGEITSIRANEVAAPSRIALLAQLIAVTVQTERLPDELLATISPKIKAIGAMWAKMVTPADRRKVRDEIKKLRDEVLQDVGKFADDAWARVRDAILNAYDQQVTGRVANNRSFAGTQLGQAQAQKKADRSRGTIASLESGGLTPAMQMIKEKGDAVLKAWELVFAATAGTVSDKTGLERAIGALAEAQNQFESIGGELTDVEQLYLQAYQTLIDAKATLGEGILDKWQKSEESRAKLARKGVEKKVNKVYTDLRAGKITLAQAEAALNDILVPLGLSLANLGDLLDTTDLQDALGELTAAIQSLAGLLGGSAGGGGSGGGGGPDPRATPSPGRPGGVQGVEALTLYPSQLVGAGGGGPQLESKPTTVNYYVTVPVTVQVQGGIIGSDLSTAGEQLAQPISDAVTRRVKRGGMFIEVGG